MAEVWLRPWRLTDADRVAVIIDDEYLRPWSTMGADLEAWIRREIKQERGSTRAICLPGDDRVVGRVALRLPAFASDAVRCQAVRQSDQPAGELSYWLIPEVRGLAWPRPRFEGCSSPSFAPSGCARSCWISRAGTSPRCDWPSASELSADARPAWRSTGREPRIRSSSTSYRSPPSRGRGLSSAAPRGVAQSGSAPGWGPGGRRFKSCLPD